MTPLLTVALVAEASEDLTSNTQTRHDVTAQLVRLGLPESEHSDLARFILPHVAALALAGQRSGFSAPGLILWFDGFCVGLATARLAAAAEGEA